ncbi:adenylate/guanylate cyclase domain-containing protein [Nocardioides sp.]|uniref:adenylate/guanylate cyclase domain-containing protein n=1 Tax=Nocardioides sp. TaxID=35761 RepID=UPI002ECFD500
MAADDAEALSGADLPELEELLLGARPNLTRQQVADRAGVPLELAVELWGQLGFPHAANGDVAFTENDVTALEQTAELVALGILEPDSQSALVRTWGRSYARLAEWQVGLLAGIALADADPAARLDELVTKVLPDVERLQAYVWRRHLLSAAHRLLPRAAVDDVEVPMVVGFTDIVGYTSLSKNLAESELVELVERFEDETTRLVVEAGGRVIKTIGDEVLYVADDPHAGVEVALDLTRRGEDDEDAFPRVRAGLAFGPVTSRLGDVFGPTVNIAARLTSVARPGTVLVDAGAREVLTAGEGHDDLRLGRVRRVSVKGYRNLEPWVVRRRAGSGTR